MRMRLSKQSHIGFIGAGKVGTSLAIALDQANYNVTGAYSKSISSANNVSAAISNCQTYQDIQALASNCEVLFITTPDDSIESTANSFEPNPHNSLVHCSGAKTINVFNSAISKNIPVGSFHPMQAFSSIENGVKSIPGTTFGIEGTGEVQSYLHEVAKELGGVPVFIQSEYKALYHLSGVILGNLLASLAAISANLWSQMNIDSDTALQALTPMISQVAINLNTSGIPKGIAGPYVRGDIGTVKSHLNALLQYSPNLLPLYCELALAGLPYAQMNGLSNEHYINIKKLLESYKECPEITN
ncbi:MAG: DUF2520 domain-containing protein [SAR202 cluster bacterium]|nr:hypothetical protein [Chloroflexota bacterium]MQG39670.1 DUF2520 domain-containing protein [SAR202 cluster bacterium]